MFGTKKQLNISKHKISLKICNSVVPECYKPKKNRNYRKAIIPYFNVLLNMKNKFSISNKSFLR